MRSLIVAIGALCTTAVFFSLFLVYYIKYEGREKPLHNSTHSSRPLTIQASLMKEKMDLAVDPCEDFAEYACGNFYKTAVFEEGDFLAASFTPTWDRINEKMKTFLTEETKPGDMNYVKNMRNLYKSCMDEAKIEEIGVQPFLNSTYAKEWPTLIGQNWTKTTFNLNDVLAKYFGIATMPMFSIAVRNDPGVAYKKTIQLAEPSFGLGRPYLTRVRNDSVLLAYERYLRDVAIELGAEPQVAALDAAAVLDLEIELAKITVAKEDRRNFTKMYNPTTLADVGKKYRYIDIPRSVRAFFAIVNMTLEDYEDINVPFPSYFEQLDDVIRFSSARTLQNLFGFHYALTKVGGLINGRGSLKNSFGGLTKKLREIKLEFDKVYLGKKEETPRWKSCLSITARPFATAMSKEFESEGKNKAQPVRDMMKNVQSAFRENLEDSTWLGNNTKRNALDKLESMQGNIGFLDTGIDVEFIEEIYSPLNMTQDDFYLNKELIFWFEIIEKIDHYLRADRKELGLATYQLNAHYNLGSNEFVLYDGILSPPFYSPELPDSLNYGGLGMVIGHEIVHGFDDQGIQYGKDRILQNWWQAEDLATFKQKVQCIIDQYGNFRDDVAEMNVNGKNTQGENIADIGGIKHSFSAYKKLAMQNGEAEKLPGLNLTHDQLFFVGYAQAWCRKRTKAATIWKLSNNVHSLEKFRILGALQNSLDFAKAYSCPVGSPMNPVNKCSVW